MCWKRHPWPWTVIMPNVMNSGQFGWKTSKDIPKCLREWCCSSLFPWSQSCRKVSQCLSRKCVGHAAHGGVTTVLSPSSRAGVYLWSWNSCLAVQGAAGLSDCPKAPGMFQDCQIVLKLLTSSELLGADSLRQSVHHSEHPLSLGEV